MKALHPFRLDVHVVLLLLLKVLQLQLQPTSAATAAPTLQTGKLDSLQFYDHLRYQAGLAGTVMRVPGNESDEVAVVNLDRFVVEGEGEITLFHFGVVIHLEEEVFLWNFEDMANIALALAHLNTGNGSIVPELAGLNERCGVRFTAEFRDSLFSPGKAVRQVFDMTSNRIPGVDRIPSAFLGDSYSFSTIPMSLVTSLLGFPQISSGATSPELDDKDNYPLFGRSVPSDTANAIPMILFFQQILKLEHLVVINVNDAYGNAYAEAMKNAAAEHAPTMRIRQIPLDAGQASIESAVRAVKESKYRFVFCLVFTSDVHNALMTEAYHQGVAGTGLHNWIFADSFWGVLDTNTFPKDSVLHKAYKGVGMMELSGGVAGIPSYDHYYQHIRELRNPIDFEYLDKLSPYYDPTSDVLWTDENPTFLEESLNGWSPFAYEAAIAFGLAACAAWEENENFTGVELYDQFLQVTFKGIVGNVSFTETGSRNAESALYSMNNFRDIENKDESGNISISWEQVNTHLFINGQWVPQQEKYLFNDGTAKLPVDMDPPPPPVIVQSDGGANITIAIVVPIVALLLIGACVFLFYEHRRKQNDAVWKIDQADLKYSDPPEVIGSGAFGLVLLAEYRGTNVAVKRAIPPKASKGDSQKSGAAIIGGGEDHSGADGLSSAVGSGIYRGNSGVASERKSGMTSLVSSSAGAGLGFKSGFASTIMGFGGITVEASSWNKLKKEFEEEMRYLSRLRHPCICLIIGAVMGKDPMLVMEYMEHGSLYDILHNETFALEGELLLPILRDISQGIRFLHSAAPQVLHGDLKAANILVDQKFRAKVADFGLSQKKNLGGTGTPYWMAPELLRFESTNTAATDVYSFGIILYEVFSRRDPYEDDADAREVLRAVADKTIRKRPPAPRGMPGKIKALMDDCVDDDPANRPSFEEIDLRLKRIDAENVIEGGDQNRGRGSQVSLFDIFPRHIAEALRDGKEVEAEHKECVTLFFCDIVGFTTISSKLDPRKVANMLDRLYKEFDGLSNKHDIFKVETIGDDQQDDHCKRIAEFAIEAIQAANGTLIDIEDPAKGYVDIRVGFHSGSVVADVVGTRNPRYCLFGDTVNKASRMESNSEKNRIHCSGAAAKILKKQCPKMPLLARGPIQVKGVGKMRTYWVNETKESAKARQEREDNEVSVFGHGAFSGDLNPLEEASEEFASSEFLSSEFVSDAMGMSIQDIMGEDFKDESSQLDGSSSKHRRSSNRRKSTRKSFRSSNKSKPRQSSTFKPIGGASARAIATDNIGDIEAPLPPEAPMVSSSPPSYSKTAGGLNGYSGSPGSSRQVVAKSGSSKRMAHAATNESWDDEISV